MQRVSAALLIRFLKQEAFGPGLAQQRCALQRVRDQANHIRSAVHVPVHRGPRHVPEPEVPLSRPKPGVIPGFKGGGGGGPGGGGREKEGCLVGWGGC